jgi:hypothetical protein
VARFFVLSLRTAPADAIAKKNVRRQRTGPAPDRPRTVWPVRLSEFQFIEKKGEQADLAGLVNAVQLH